MSGHYDVETKDLINVVSKCLSVIGLGEKAESNSITVIFGKKSITVEAVNQNASYQSSLVCDVVTPFPMKMHILPELLLAYAKAHKIISLKPNKQSLSVTAGKNFSAEIYFIGQNEPIEIEKPDQNNDIEKIASAATTLLNMVAGVRNRTDQQLLGIMLEWGNNLLELTIGDSHHAVVIDYMIKEKHSDRVIMDLPNLARIMEIGQHFATKDNRFIAWSDTEYLSIANKSEDVFTADQARDVIKEAKRQTKTKVDTTAFASMVETLTSAVEETAIVNFKITDGKILATVKTGSSSAKSQIKTTDFKGKEVSMSVAAHHMKDCLSTMKEKQFTISVFNNMLAFESQNKLIKCVAAMSSVGSK